MIALAATLAEALKSRSVTILFSIEIAGYLNPQGKSIIYTSGPVQATEKDVRPLALPLQDNSSSVGIDDFRTTFSGTEFTILDRDNEITSRLDDFDFVGKNVIVKIGVGGVPYADFLTIFSGIIENISLGDDGVSWAFKTIDTQENLEQYVLHAKSTTLSAALGSFDTTISVVSTTGFDLAGPFTDLESIGARGYLLIGSGTTAEIVRWTGKTATTFTGVIRAEKGTTNQFFASGVAVKELIVWPGHPLEILAVMLTGNTLEEAASHASVPSGWKVGIPLSIDTASWLAAKDRTRTFLYELRASSKLFASTFAQQEILQPLHLFVRSSSLNVVSLVSFIERPIAASEYRKIVKDRLGSKVSWEGQAYNLINRAQISYDLNPTSGAFDTIKTFTETSSQSRFGVRDLGSFQLSGIRTDLGGEALSEIIAREHFLIFAFLHGLVTWKTGLLQMDLEVGDLVKLTHDRLPHIAEGRRGVTDHAIKILQKRVSFEMGEISFEGYDASILSSLKFPVVAPDGSPAFGSATAEQQAELAYLGRSFSYA